MAEIAVGRWRRSGRVGTTEVVGRRRGPTQLVPRSARDAECARPSDGETGGNDGNGVAAARHEQPWIVARRGAVWRCTGAEGRPVRCQKPAALKTRESGTDELLPSTSNCRRGTIRCEQINCPGSSRREFYWAVAKLIVETGRLLQAAITQQKHNVINQSKSHQNPYIFPNEQVMNLILYNKN